ncbi:MAG TPA: FTR1 family protein [Gammaproteobacteria bacterium]|nr:FTR1 family protein [Gammaproteobacteria bacterium]
MYSSLLIVFREILEAALVISIVMAASRNVSGRGRFVSFGLIAGSAGAVVVAIFAEMIAQMFEGVGQEVFNAIVLFLAVGMLAWHNIWMARHGRELAHNLSSVSKDVAAGKKPLYFLSVVTGLAVLREGSEIVLFMYGLIASGSDSASLLTGSALGLLSGTAVGFGMYFGLLRVSQRYLFSVTSVLILLLAAGMAAQGSQYLTQAGYLPEYGPLWDTSAILPMSSVVGQILHALVGYVSSPTIVQLSFYLVTAALILLGSKTLGRRPSLNGQSEQQNVSTG